MNLLMVSPNLPHPSWGAGTRNHYLLKILACRHTVSLLALVDSAEVESYQSRPLLQDFTHTTQLIIRPVAYSKRLQQLKCVVGGRSYLLDAYTSVEMQEALDTLVAGNHYDALFFEGALIAGYRTPKDIRVIIDQHNIEYELLQRTYQHERAGLRKWYNLLESRLLKPVEIERCRRADVVLVTSERERLAWKNMLPCNVIEVVPNGVDIEMFQGICAAPQVPSRIIFTGAMNYYPNIDAVLFFAQHCWPVVQARVPGATWQIVGSNPSAEVLKLAQFPGITVTGWVPDVRPYLAAAEVAIVPLQIGSGTRLKILEALAMQKAVVSTSVGCEGLSVESGKHLIVADQPGAFAQAVVDLIRQPEMRIELGTGGRSLVEAEYSWERCGAELLRIIEKIF